MNPFTAFARSVHKTRRRSSPLKEGVILALDPGETTGWSSWELKEHQPGVWTFTLLRYGQENTWPIEKAVNVLTGLFAEVKPIKVVHESYNIYAHKISQHVGSNVPTLRVIGCIETICHQQQILCKSQTASAAKGFCTDKNLRSWGLYVKGVRHALDSIRHGAYYILFG